LIKDSLEVFVSSLGDWSVNFKVRWDIEVSKYDRKLPSRLYEKIYKAINEAGIWFPFPTYEIQVTKFISWQIDK
jgi:small-conductance mechanosensitive channel